MYCNKQHRYLQIFDGLNYAQNNQHQGRHKCVGCAYVDGLMDAIGGVPMKGDLSHLPDSQAGTGRHKDAMEAYILGYRYGIEINS